MDGEKEEFKDGETEENTVIHIEESNVKHIMSTSANSPPKETPTTDSATKTNGQHPDKVQGLLDLEGKTTEKDAEECGVGARKKTSTTKGKQYELESLKECRTSALRQVTREMNKIKPLLQDFKNFDFVSSEIEVLNGLIAKLYDAHDKYLNSLKNDAEIDDAVTWFETHDGAIFTFKKTVCEYVSNAKSLRFEMNSFTATGSRHSSRKSVRSKYSISSSTSSKSRLIEAKTRVASLEVKAAFLKKKQALKMAAEELELKENLAQAKEEEKIFEQLNKEEFSSTPISAPGLPHLPIANLLPSYILSLNEDSPVNHHDDDDDDIVPSTMLETTTTPTKVSTTTTASSKVSTATTASSKVSTAATTSPRVSTLTTSTAASMRVSTTSTTVSTSASTIARVSTTVTSTLPAVSSYRLLPTTTLSPAKSSSAYTTGHQEPHVSSLYDYGRNAPIYVNSMSSPYVCYQTPVQANPANSVGHQAPESHGLPLSQPHYGYQNYLGNTPTTAQLSTRDDSFQEFVEIQRKQTELSQLIVSQQARSLLPTHKPPTFSGDAMEFPAFMTAFESLIESKVDDSCERLYFLGQYTLGKAKELINGCLQRKSEDSYNEAKMLLKRQFGDPFKIANAYITKLSAWPSIKPNDGPALQDFSIAMEQAKSAMKGMSHMNDLNTAHVLRQLWEKLPRHLRSKWTERNSRTKSVKGRIADFEEFSQFVREQAELATDPVFSEESVSKLPLGEKDKVVTHFKFGKRPPQRGRGTSFATDVSRTSKDQGNIVCSLCNKSHNLNECEQFLLKSLSDRRDFVKEKKLCYGCFSDQHIAKNCKDKQSCKTCSKQHPTSLHDNNWTRKPKSQSERKEFGNKPQVSSNRTAVCNITDAGDIPINMGILPVWLYHKDDPDKMIKVYALLDNGSGGTFIKEESAKRLGIEGSDTDLILTTIHGTHNVSTKAIEGLVVANIKSTDVIVDLPRTFTRKVIPADRSEIPRPDVISKMSHMKDVSKEMHPYMEDIEVGLLIGLNCPSALRPRDIVYGNESDPYAVRSLLGWYINGPINTHKTSYHDNVNCNSIHFNELNTSTTAKGYVVSQRTVKEQITPQAVERMFELDFSEKEKGTAMSRDDLKFYDTVEKGIVHLEDLHYEMPLPLKDQNLQLPNNYVQAEKRLNSLKKRLSSDDQYYTDYRNFMSEIISKGYARRIDAQSTAKDGRIWYLPHHGIYHPQKPTKVRVVFDCSARYEGQSLNDKLLQGPDLTSKLIGVLTRFRQERYAFMADIEKMFFQVKVREEDQSLLRFLWWQDGDIEKEPEEYCMTVHLFGAGSSPACANYALKRTADDNEEEYGLNVANTLRRNFYVDDVLKSAQTENEAIKLAKDVKKVCANGGFNLTKFVGNTERIIDSVPQEHRAANVRNLALGQDKLPIERVLGVHWCIESDAFKFRIELKDKPCTRRGILSTISSVYDPLGFIAPVVLVGKKILQDICHTSNWDEPVDDETRSRWEKWRNELYQLEKLNVPRSFKPAEFGKIVSAQLHSMSDASTTGYGQCSYLRLEDEHGKVYTSFVMGKARVTPKRTVTIPRLELAAAAVSVKIADALKEELEYENIEDHYWTDSKVVLGFISNESKRFHVYVANRVQLIQDHSSPSQWHYVETGSNPADEGSRGMSAKNFIEKSKWIEGPDFLKEPRAKWLEAESYKESVDPNSPEVKNIRVNTNVLKESGDMIKRLERFSSWQKAKTAVALCLRYKRKLREKVKSKDKEIDTSKEKTRHEASGSSWITVKDLEEAETEIIKLVQGDAFTLEIKSLQDIQANTKYGSRESDKAKKATLKRSSTLHSLDPFLDHSGILRVGGRIRKASLSASLKNPVILPKSSHVTSLVISHVHERTHHSGRGITLNELRTSGYWVINGNAMVRRFISKCVNCRYLRGTIGEQKMADLPQSRVEPAPPFTYCAVDYFGPWHVQRGRTVVKRYGALFTCLASRAVHVEVSDSLETDSFIQALRRFICRRGPVREMRCDRGTNFIGAEAELKRAIEEIDDEKVKAELLKDNIDWIKNPASASNFGGVWERQIRSIRNVMNQLIREHGHRLDEESLRTFLCEAEATINHRPLTVETLSDPLSEPPLSPSMLLTGKTKLVLPPPGEFKRDDLYCRRKWRRTQHLAQEFWSRWSKEYLQQLQARTKWTQPRRNFKTGDVVLLKENQSPRNRWSLARVVNAHPDDQDQVRSVTVLTPSGSKLERPINKLVLLVESQ